MKFGTSILIWAAIAIMLLLAGCNEQQMQANNYNAGDNNFQPNLQNPGVQPPQDNNTRVNEVEKKPYSINGVEIFPTGCEKPKFTEYFVDLNYIQYFGQIGTVHGSGQFMVERSYVYVSRDFYNKKIPVYAPTKMTLTRGAYYDVSGVQNEFPDYALYFDAGCNVEVLYAHLKEVDARIASQFGEPKQDSRTEQLKPVTFNAGEIIGYFILVPDGVAAFDFITHDFDVNNIFANQARHTFGYGDNLLHGTCPYDYYLGEKKERLYELIGGIAKEEKECGPISRDYNGTISGQWFLEKEVTRASHDYTQEGTYGSSLVIAGDIDRIIIGRLGNRATTFIYPNSSTYKDPKEITTEHCYQIIDSMNPSASKGYIYFKLIDNETLKVIYSENGTCPSTFPQSGGAIYYR